MLTEEETVAEFVTEMMVEGLVNYHSRPKPPLLYPDIHVSLQKRQDAGRWIPVVAVKLLRFCNDNPQEVKRFKADIDLCQTREDIAWVIGKYVDVRWV